MAYDFFELQEHVIDADQLINQYYSFVQDYNNQIDQLEKETNAKIDVQTQKAIEEDKKGLEFARYLDSLQDDALDIISKAESMYKYYKQSGMGSSRIEQEHVDVQDVTFDTQTIDDERLVDITNVRHRVEDGYENVLKVFERLEKNDFQQPLLKLQEILEDYHDMHL